MIVVFFSKFYYNSYMRFELTEALLGEILFSMEDQGTDYLLDTREGQIITSGYDEFDSDVFDDNDDEDETEDEDRFISLPEWGAQDGFRLMERFTAELRNSLVREELSAALNRGRGVFRAFKDVIGQYPETEKLWFKFKDREMKREVIEWYNAYREEWGMELIGFEPDEDTSGLVNEDFLFREGTDLDSEKASNLHKRCLEDSDGENHTAFEAADSFVFPGDICFVAETAGGEFSGYICAAYKTPSVLHIFALEVDPKYRGLGLGKALLGRLLEKADAKGAAEITIDLSSESEKFSRVLLMEKFKPRVQRYLRKN